MNKMKLLVSIVVFVGLVVVDCQNPAPPLPCPQLDGYDITNLTLAVYWNFDINSTVCLDDGPVCHFFFTFCRLLPETKDSNCVNSSVCQSNGTHINELGEYTENPFSPKEDNGFIAKFTSTRTTADNDSKSCSKVSIILEFDCNKNEPWIPGDSNSTASQTPEPNFFNFTQTDDTCEYYVQFDYAGACHRIQPTTTTTTSPVPMTTTTTIFNPTPSKLCVPPSGYDIAHLTKPPFWVFNIKEGCALETNFTDSCSLYIAFCKPIENVLDCDGAGSCLRYPNRPGSTVIVGNFTANPFSAYVKDGFESTYPNGSLIYNRISGKECFVSLKVKFQCDPNAKWEVPPEDDPGVGPDPLLFEPITADSCQLKMTVPYSGACSGKKNKGMSTGSVLVLIFFISVSVYLLVGICYNSLVANKTGVDMIPHFDFWSAILLYALDGLFWTWRFITCKNTRNEKLKYDQI